MVFCLSLFLLGEKPTMTLTILDVGQGSGAHVQTDSGFEMIIDAGESLQTLRELGRVRSPFDSRIDMLVGSHADRDHIGMFPEILKRYHVNTFVHSPYGRQGAVFEEVGRLVEEQSVQNWSPDIGVIYEIDSQTRVLFLHPLYAARGLSDNDSSLVFILYHQDVSFLFMGDVSGTIEMELVRRYGGLLDVDVLIVGHHGSKTSTDPDFVRVVSPQYAVISAGADNRYGHPHTDTLQALQQHGSVILRTDRLGSVQFTVNKEGELEIFSI